MSPKDEYKRAVGKDHHDDGQNYEQEPTSAKATLLYVVVLLGVGLTVGVVAISLFNWILPL